MVSPRNAEIFGTPRSRNSNETKRNLSGRAAYTSTGMSSPLVEPLLRRRVLQVIGCVLGSIAGSTGCESAKAPAPARDPWDDFPGLGVDELDPYPGEDDGAAASNVRTLMDVLLPAEHDEAGDLLSPGALEAGAYEVLRLENFIDAARSQALLPSLPEAVYGGLERFDDVFQAIVSVDLDTLADEISPLSAFRNLPRVQQIEAVTKGLDDPLRGPLLQFVRAACFIAYLGAANSDVGLQQLGFPPFEDFEGGLAVSGYPRTANGRRIDPETEDLAALDAAGDLDDYTYNREPAPTSGDDLLSVLNEQGDFY